MVLIWQNIFEKVYGIGGGGNLMCGCTSHQYRELTYSIAIITVNNKVIQV